MMCGIQRYVEISDESEVEHLVYKAILVDFSQDQHPQN